MCVCVCVCAFSKSTGRAYSIIAGVPHFEGIRTGGHAYVDKSRYAALLSEESSMCLLVRPRRQGKSLLLSTTQCLLERKENLFRGLAVHDEIDWHDGGVPVIKMDLSTACTNDGEDPVAGVEIFDECLRRQVRQNAKRLEVEVAEGMPSKMFQDLLLAVSKKTDGKKKAAVLIDEYDAPLIAVLGKNGGEMDERVRKTRGALHMFLLATKSSMDLIHCLFLTGVSKFALADTLSQMNHLDDITHDKRFGAATGFSWVEIEAAFGPHVETLAGSRNETVPELRAQMERCYGGNCYDGHHRVFNTWDVSCALQKQRVDVFWLSMNFGGWLCKLLMPNVAPALFEEGVIIPKWGDGNKLDKGLFEAVRNNSPIDERQVWRVLLEVGYLTVVEMKDINHEASLVLKPPNDCVAAAVRTGIFQIFDRALCSALYDDDMVQLVTDTAAIVEKHRFYRHGGNVGGVQEPDVQKWYAIAWGALRYEFVSEQATFNGRSAFVFEGIENTHVVEFGMVTVSGGTSKNGSEPKSERKSEIDSALKKKTTQVRGYVVALKNKKPIRWWVALFNKAKGELVHVSEVSLMSEV